MEMVAKHTLIVHPSFDSKTAKLQHDIAMSISHFTPKIHRLLVENRAGWLGASS